MLCFSVLQRFAPLGNDGDLDEDPVAGRKVEVVRPLDDELRDLGGEDDAGRDGGLALAHEGLQQSAELLQQEDDARADDPLPELGRVQDEECPVAPIELKNDKKL